MLLQVPERSWTAAAVHDTVQVILKDPAFRRSLRRSLADRILVWLADALTRIAKAMHGLPSGRTLALIFVGAMVLFVLMRFLVAASARGEAVGLRAKSRVATTGVDPWRSADELLASGRYEDAAHALYRGVILSLSRAERLRLDPSKTSGDYARELRRRSSSSLSPFVRFARRFDVLVYGHIPPDATAVEQLRELAAPFRARSLAA
ncbi:MAG: DUF4129 domain-containing protein [Gemmatimonadota bacterium]|nr:DUF4129 domain-containing protein [Gemmatimonadota bacterium]